MTFAVPTVTVYFGLTGLGGDFFTIGHTTKGKLDDVTYLLAGDLGVDVAAEAYTIDVTRGRSRDLTEFVAGSATINLRNVHGDFSSLNAESPYYGELVPGKRVTVSIYGQTIFDGVIESWSSTQRPFDDCDATITATDALGQLARKEFSAWTGTAAQAPGARISAALNRSEVNFGVNRDIDVGVSTLQADVVSAGTNVLSYLQLVTESDQGRLYATRENVITFRDRHSVHPITDPSITFCDADWINDGDPETLSRVPFAEIMTVAASDLLYNRVAVTREGGTAQVVNDTASQTLYEIRSLGLSGLLMDSDTQSLDMAGYLLGAYKEPRERIGSVVVYVSSMLDRGKDPGQLAALELSAVAVAEYTPCGGTTEVAQRLIVDGVEHHIDVFEGHTLTVYLSDVMEAASFLLDDASYGELDDDRLGF